MTADVLGGVFTHAVDLVTELGRQDVEVVLATFGAEPTAAQRRRALKAGVSRLESRPLALEWMPEPWPQVQAGQEWLLELEQRERPDVVHLNAYAHAAAGFTAPRLIGAHSCVWSWWEAVHGGSPPPPWRRYREAVRAGLASADAVVAPSESMLAGLERHWGPLPPITRVIFNGSRSPVVPSGAAKKPYALAAGRFWDEAKNLPILGRVAATPGVAGRILLAGAAGRNAEARRLRLLGELGPESLRRVRDRAAVFVSPVRYEPFGLAILEAARSRCALLLADIPSLREVWGDAARWCAPDDVEGLSAALLELLEHPAVAAELGERALVRSRRYAAAEMGAAYGRLYRELVGARVGAYA